MSFFSWLFGAEKKSPQYLAAAKLFTPHDLTTVEELFVKFAGSRTARLGEAQFCDLFGLEAKPLSAALFAAAAGMATPPGPEAAGKAAQPPGVSLEDVVVLLASARGSESEKADLCHRIVGGGGEAGGQVTRAAVARAVGECAAAACGLPGEKQLSEGFADSLVEGLPAGGKPWSDGSGALRAPPLGALREAICGMVAGVAPGEAPSLPELAVPALTLPKGVDLMGCLLRREWAWLLSAGLPKEMRSEWRMAFSSRLHGASYSTFLGRAGGQGASVVLIKDKQGGVMGGLAEESWARTPNFYGGFRTKVFSLWPKVAVHSPSGVNENFQWCGVSFTSMPNGFGFGGQQGHFGVFVDASFDHGMTRPAATFASPSLLDKPVFEVDTVECWLIGPKEEADGGGKGKGPAGGGSVLDRFKEDRMVVTLGGAASDHSAGYRD